ncbi:Retrovirus-related Pol polyprotein from transposon RE2 [Linum perenne]
MHAYLQRAKAISDQLSALGAPISYDDLVFQILNGLDDPYRPYSQSMESLHEAFSYADLHRFLRSKEIELQELVAMFTNRGGSRVRFSRGRGRGRGHFMDSRPSHFSSNPIGSYNSRSTSHTSAGLLGSGPTTRASSSTLGLICHNFGGRGHIRCACPSPHFDSPNQAAQPNYPPSSNLASSPSQPTGSQSWVLDSGTNHHLTSDLENLAQHTKYADTEEVTFKNGKTLHISHTCSSTIRIQKFALRDLGTLSYFLGIEVLTHPDGLLLC